MAIASNGSASPPSVTGADAMVCSPTEPTQCEGKHAFPAVVQLLQRLLAIDSVTPATALTRACDVVADALGADKVDAFVHEASRDSLEAIGASTQPLSIKQRSLGLDVLPVSNGGRAAEVFQTGRTYFNNRVGDDTEELAGIRDALAIRSAIGVPLTIGGRQRGVVMVASQTPDLFTNEDVRFAESIARWVGLVAHRSELLLEASRTAAVQARRQVAEELVTVLAHDLRNLLGPITARLELLARRARQEGRDKDLTDAAGALRTTRRMDSFISDMLHVTRIDHGVFAMQVDSFDLVGLVDEVAATFSSPETPVAVVAAGPVPVVGDRRRLRQCLENLSSNAVQHSPPGSQVTLTVVELDREGAGWSRVEVRDQGIGVPADVLPFVFERFVTGGESGGLGLGLYLAKQIALAHGGDLTVESAPQQGTVFRLDLPTTARH